MNLQHRFGRVYLTVFDTKEGDEVACSFGYRSGFQVSEYQKNNTKYQGIRMMGNEEGERCHTTGIPQVFPISFNNFPT